MALTTVLRTNVLHCDILSPHWPKSGGQKIFLARSARKLVPPTFKTVSPPMRDCHFLVLNGQNILQYIFKTSAERFELQIVTTTHRRRNGFEVDGHKVRRKF